MKTNTRTQYSAKNTSVSIISRIIAILMGFITRVVFTHMLSESYVGVNGLFTDILNVLALSELGIDTAITFVLYRPIAEGNQEEQKSLMHLYRWLYRMVAAFLVVGGLAVIPFMDVLIKNRPNVDHLIVIYLLYLLNSALSYLLIYKRTLIDAHQMMYIGIVYQTVFLVLQDILQIIILLFSKNFILFLLIYIMCTLGGNICISRKANQLYPFLKEKDIKPLSNQKRKEIFKNVRAMLMHKIGDVVVNNTDNLLISSFVGITSVGYYSNYYLIIGSIRQVLDQIFEGITASVGNLGATEEPGRVKRVFESAHFVGQWLYGFAAICLFELLNPFVELSFGENYLFHRQIVLILCINFLINGMRKATLVFRDSLGLFWFDRYKAIVEAVINLIVSILLVKQFGVVGVFLGTFISTILTSAWVEPYILYKHHLGTTSKPYFYRYMRYVVVIGLIWWLTDLLCQMVGGSLVVLLFKRLFICLIVPNLIMTGVYIKTKEFQFILAKVRDIVKRRK
ncbi:MAG: lipopolysaccharide biosynthesis protein [Velocimicrobium sp.]